MHSMSTMWTLATFRTSFQHVCVQRIRANYASRGSRCKENCVMLVVGGLRHDSAHLLSRTFNILVACNTCPGAMCTCHRAREDFADAGRRCSGLGPDSRHASGGRGPQSLEGIWVCTWCFLKLPTAANWCDVTIPSHDRLAAIPPSRGQTGVFDRWEKQDEPRSHAVRVLGAICWAEPDPSHIRRGSRGATEFTWSNTCFASRWRRKGLQTQRSLDRVNPRHAGSRKSQRSYEKQAGEAISRRPVMPEHDRSFAYSAIRSFCDASRHV